MARKLHVDRQVFPIAGRFSIARGSRTEAVVVTVTLTEDGAAGRGECVPYARYGETVDGVIATIEGIRGVLESGLDRHALLHDVAGLLAPREASPVGGDPVAAARHGRDADDDLLVDGRAAWRAGRARLISAVPKGNEQEQGGTGHPDHVWTFIAPGIHGCA